MSQQPQRGRARGRAQRAEAAAVPPPGVSVRPTRLGYQDHRCLFVCHSLT